LESVGGSSMSEPVPYNSIILEMESGPFSRATPISDPAPFREMSAMSTGLPSFRRAVGSVRVVAVTASLQGLTSLHRLIHALPADFPVPVLVSHEITRSNDRGLAEWLNETAHVHVREARMDDGIYGGTVYLAPVHRYFGVSADETAILADEPPPGMFASASSSFLFSSIARVYGTAALAVVLSGSRGPDLLGLRSLHMAGSRILVDQDALDQRSSLRPEGLASFAHTVVSPTVLPSEVYDSVFHQALG